jgi:hypothetical protein
LGIDVANTDVLHESAQRWNYFKSSLLILPVTALSWRSSLATAGWWSCPIRRATGCPCPTCGMTRAFVAIGHGQWQAAWNYHAFSFGLFAGCILIGGRAAIELLGNRSLSTAYPKFSPRPIWYLGFGTAYFLYYFYRLYYQLIP